MIKNIFIICTLFIIVGCKGENKPQTSANSEITQEDDNTPKDNNIQKENNSLNDSSLSPKLIKNFTGKDNIIIYSAFANSKSAIIKGRAQEKKELLKATKEDGFFSNLVKSFNLVNNDELKNKTIIAVIDDFEYKIKTDDEGYFTFEIIDIKKPLKMGYKKIGIHLENNVNIHETNLTVITKELDEKIVGIISDIDDTVLISNVTEWIDLAVNSLGTNFKQRKVVPTMKDRFNLILNTNPKSVPSTLFFVSGSPRKFLIPIESFLEYNSFPKHNTFLKEINLFDDFSQTSYKTSTITSIIALYPNIEWILYGDSGESDQEIYQGIKDDFPKQVKGFHIRNVETGKIKDIFKESSVIDNTIDAVTDFFD